MAQEIRGSFRDPAGVVYMHDGVLYRQVHHSAKPLWEPLEASGLLDEWMRDGLLVPHEEVGLEFALDERAWKVLRPQMIPFISFPYEWSVRQLLDAALLTLDLQRRAIEGGFSLRDASAYNVQFQAGQPVFIDTLSFGPWDGSSPWVAYGQFCRHFLAPLALYHWVGPELRGLLRSHIDGLPLPLVSRMLPSTSWMRFGIASHIHLHARATSRYGQGGDGGEAQGSTPSISKAGMLGMLDNLRGTLLSLDSRPTGTEWGEYYGATNYSEDAAASKADLVAQGLACLADAGVRTEVVWDLGANTGRYSRVAHDAGAMVVSFDVDESAVDRHWRSIRSASPPPNILPLVSDLTNPSPSLGWAHEERPSLKGRGPADVIFALALIHHLALSNNTPLPRIASWLSSIGKGAIVEMVPKEDSQVRHLLATREDIFPSYTLEGFEEAFLPYFEILAQHPVAGSTRVLYVLKTR